MPKKHSSRTPNIDSRCVRCGYCLAICPEKAIRFKNRRMIVIAEKCRACGACFEVCPVGAIGWTENAPEPRKNAVGEVFGPGA